MEITHRVGFLVSSYDLPTKTSRVRIESTLGEVIANWGSSTRLSPLYAISNGDGRVLPGPSLEGDVWLAFCGPLNPATLPEIPVGVTIWLTLGTFNVIAIAYSQAATKAFSEQLRSVTSTPYEVWRLSNGVVKDVVHGGSEVSESPVPPSLIQFANLDHIPPELHTSASEYCALMASSLSRTKHALPELVPDLLAIHNFTIAAFRTAKLEDRTDLYRLLGILAHLNAGLSRFCAQTLSGISPIHQTECHFWIHSLLGTGIANIVLHRFASYIQSKIDNKFITARLRKLGERTEKLPDLYKATPNFWHENHLEGVHAQPPGPEDAQVPLLTYFSGRDGFRSGLNTVSAPLASIGACNARQWSLMTMTHEISHIAVRGALAVLFADPEHHSGIAILQAWLAKRDNTWLSRLQFFLLDTIISMQQTFERTSHADVTRNWDERTLAAVLDRWHHEVEEIIVHVFDFLYFHGQDTERYVRGIWTTWGVIPNISNRVNEYVTRTLCAILVKHLRRENAEDIARAEVLKVLEQLRSQNPGPYIELAYAFLSNDAHWPALRSAVTARKGLVKLVRGFLYWDKAVQDVRGDPTVSSDASERGGYRLRVHHLTKELVENPLRVVEEYTDSLKPSEVTSVWLLYALAFNVRVVR